MAKRKGEVKWVNAPMKEAKVDPTDGQPGKDEYNINLAQSNQVVAQGDNVVFEEDGGASGELTTPNVVYEGTPQITADSVSWNVNDQENIKLYQLLDKESKPILNPNTDKPYEQIVQYGAGTSLNYSYKMEVQGLEPGEYYIIALAYNNDTFMSEAGILH